jgi:hypothetical protein
LGMIRGHISKITEILGMIRGHISKITEILGMIRGHISNNQSVKTLHNLMVLYSTAVS